MSCGTERHLELDVVQKNELVQNGQLRLLCAGCGTVTAWHGLQLDRRAGEDRRASRHARIKLAMRVRCNTEDLKFTEVASTITASRYGASFASSHNLLEGMLVYVILPYSEGDSESLEKQARVVRVESKGAVRKVGIQILA